MFLVDNFKIFLLVGLICAVGVPIADAQGREKGPVFCYDDMENKSVRCLRTTDASACVNDEHGKAMGCTNSETEECVSGPKQYCCQKPDKDCNDLSNPDNKKACIAATKGLGYPPCKEGGGDDPKTPTDKPNNNGTNSTASGLVPNYYGGIPVVAAVIPIFLVSLKSFS